MIHDTNQNHVQAQTDDRFTHKRIYANGTNRHW